MGGYMYILECADGSYYTGSTKYLEKRLEQHQNGDGANHTKMRLPVKLVYTEHYPRIDLAFNREKQVQGWSRKKKEALINGEHHLLPELAKAYRDIVASSTSATSNTSASATSNTSASATSNTSASATKTQSTSTTKTQSTSTTSNTSTSTVAEAKVKVPEAKTEVEVSEAKTEVEVSEALEDTGFEKYPEYKDSEEYWLGQIPEHWRTKRLKHIFHEKKITHNPTLSCGAISFGEVIEKDDDKTPLSTKASYQEVLEGEFLVNPLNLNYDLKSLRIALSEINVVVSSVYIVLKNHETIDKNYYRWLLHRYDVAYMKLLGSGVRQTISFNHIANSSLAFPPISEQTAIAQFLDKKTAKIDQAIAKKERLIKLLKERKQALIQQAVTKGLDPTVKMKDSGVDWIGDIPEHWEVKRLRHLGQTQNGISAGAEYFGSGFPFVSYSDVYKNIELPIEVKSLAKSSNDDQLAYSVQENDVFFTRTSETADEIGFSSVCFETIENATFAGFLIRFRPTFKLLFKGFSKYYFSSKIHRSYFAKEMNLVTRASLSQILLKSMPVVLPPIQEQQKIFGFLETASIKLTKSISLQKRQIKKLKEYKASLIDAAVTGKIKVS